MKNRRISLLERHSNKRWRINCSKALNIEHILNIEPEYVGRVTSKSGFKIKKARLRLAQKSLG